MTKGCLLAVFLGLFTLSLAQDANCIKSDPKQGCLLCTPDFFVWQGACVPVPIGCDIFDRIRARCIFCKQGYTISDGVCQGGPQQGSRQMTSSSNAQMGGVAVAMGGSSSSSSGNSGVSLGGFAAAPAGTAAVAGSDFGSWQTLSSGNLGGSTQSRTSTTTTTTSSSSQSSNLGGGSSQGPVSETQRTESRQTISVVGGPVDSVLIDRSTSQPVTTSRSSTQGAASGSASQSQLDSNRAPRFEYSTSSDSTLGALGLLGGASASTGAINNWQPLGATAISSVTSTQQGAEARSAQTSQSAQVVQTSQANTFNFQPQTQGTTVQTTVTPITATIQPINIQATIVPNPAQGSLWGGQTQSAQAAQANKIEGAMQANQFNQQTSQSDRFGQSNNTGQFGQTGQSAVTTVTTVTQTTPQFAIGPVPSGVTVSGPTGPTQTEFAWTQPATTSEKTYSDANCRKYSDDQKSCLECSNRFYLNKATKLCSMVNPQCQTYDKESGSCTSCYKGYVLYQGQCYIPAGGQAEVDNNCKVPSADGNCQECYRGFIVINGKCRIVNNLCKTYDTAGACLSCYPGYALNAGKCSVATDAEMGADPNCRNSKDGVCVQCSGGFFLKDNVCRQVSPQCRTFNAQSGACTTCYAGYSLKGPDCVPATAETIETNCKSYVNNECTECSKGYVLRGSNCIQVSPLCRTFNENTGFCTSCYAGYALQDGVCNLSKQVGVDTSNCRKWENSKCLECSERFYFDQNGVCVAVSDLCATYDKTGACTQCYPGYYISGRTCLKADPTQQDPNCRNFKDGQCVQCSGGYILRNSRCLQVNPLCRTFNNQTGACTTCYAGYSISNGNCIRAESSDGDSNCKKFENGQCVECANRYIRKGGSCAQVSDLCATYDNVSGDCLTCYKGYGLMNGICAKILLVTDPPPQAPQPIAIDAVMPGSSSARQTSFESVTTSRSSQLGAGDAQTGTSGMVFGNSQAAVSEMSQSSSPTSFRSINSRSESGSQPGPTFGLGFDSGVFSGPRIQVNQDFLRGGTQIIPGFLRGSQVGFNKAGLWGDAAGSSGSSSSSSSSSSSQGGVTTTTRTSRTVTTSSQQGVPSSDFTSQLWNAGDVSGGSKTVMTSSQLRTASSAPGIQNWSMP